VNLARVEDPALLCGQGQFLDDLDPCAADAARTDRERARRVEHQTGRHAAFCLIRLVSWPGGLPGG
jgi:hypothetical protein